MAQPPKCAIPESAPLLGLGVSMSMRMALFTGAGSQLATVNEALFVAFLPSVVVAVTPRTWEPFASWPVSRRKLQPTAGQPGRPGYAAQTSVRVMPYVAVP